MTRQAETSRNGVGTASRNDADGREFITGCAVSREFFYNRAQSAVTACGHDFVISTDFWSIATKKTVERDIFIAAEHIEKMVCTIAGNEAAFFIVNYNSHTVTSRPTIVTHLP